MIFAIDRRARGRGANRSTHMVESIQDYVDRVFGTSVANRRQQEPSELCKERQRTFEENSKKIDALRRAQLSQA